MIVKTTLISYSDSIIIMYKWYLLTYWITDLNQLMSTRDTIKKGI